MNDRATGLQRVVDELRRRWGARGAYWGSEATEIIAVIGTGTVALDQALGIGGVPRGRLTEFIGSPTSGMTTLALRLLAHAQQQGDLAAYLDLAGTFDAEYAAACGVDLHALLLVQPATATEALELLAALVASSGIGLLIADQLGELQANPNHAPLLDTALRRLAGPLAASPCALVALSVVPYSPALLRSIGFRGSTLAHAAAICIHVARAAWTDDPLRLGCVAQVLILKHRLGGDYATATIALDFAPLLVAS